MKFIFAILAFASLCVSVWMSGSYYYFIDWPSLIFVIFPLAGLLMAKHGKLAFTFYKESEDVKQKVAHDGGIYSILIGFLGTLVGIIVMFANISDQAALGPAMAVSFVSTIYGLLAYLFVFFPFMGNKGEA
ncbi:MAG: MotA/TolQ/ExbB proton channel family protein [Oligoflexia bacterium]|nr:MotA/TolQ/ExbB proton channel family protein [Oligoflexia bacterium]